MAARPIILHAFGAVAILALISALSVWICCGGALDHFSRILFDCDGSKYFIPTLEMIPTMLSVVMLTLSIGVFMLIRIGNVCRSKFYAMNKKCQDYDQMDVLIEKADKLPHVTYLTLIIGYFSRLNPREAWDTNNENIRTTEILIFYSLRKEFIQCRNSLVDKFPCPI